MRKADGSRENLGMVLGLIAVTAFSLTLPITRYLTQYLTPWEIGLGRTLLAGMAAVLVLLAARHRWPSKSEIKKLAITASGISLGFPVLTAIGMQTVPASHGGIILGALPLATSLIGCYLSGERPSISYWIMAVIGFGLVVVFSILSHGGQALALYAGDLALVGAVVMAGLGYAQGGQLAKSMGGWQVICWTLAISLPVLLLPAIAIFDFQHFTALPVMGWTSFLFLSLVNSLIGFFFWYAGLAIGGIARVSQTQLLQPFLTFFAAVILLGEPLGTTVLVFTGLVVLTVVISKRTPITERAVIQKRMGVR